MDAQRILQNPHLEIIPDHAGPHHGPVRLLFTNAGQTEDQANSNSEHNMDLAA